MRVKLLLPVHARNKVDEGSWMPDEEGRGRTLAAKTLQGEAAEAFNGEYDGDDKLVANLAPKTQIRPQWKTSEARRGERPRVR